MEPHGFTSISQHQRMKGELVMSTRYSQALECAGRLSSFRNAKLALLALFFIAGCSTVARKSDPHSVIPTLAPNQVESAFASRQKGLASWYGKKFHGHRTASGERFN